MDIEFGTAHRVHRQPHAVHRNRALARDIAREGARRPYPKQAIRPRPPEMSHLADAVHVPRNEMAAEPVGHPQRLLEVDFARLVEAPGAARGLPGQVNPELFPGPRADGKANPVPGDAVPMAPTPSGD